MLHGALVVEAVGEGQVLGVVGDGHVFVAVCLGGLGHFFDGVAAIGLDSVHVDVALQVGLLDQSRQGMLLGFVNLAQVLSHFGRDVVQL